MKVLLRLTILLLCAPCVADDADDLYESLDDITLGRVFMTQADRRALDARRSVSPVNAAVEATDVEPDAEQVDSTPRRPAAGYIASGDGTALVWANGGFVPVELSEAERLKFPGAVRIRSTDTGVTDDAGDGGKPGDRDSSATSPQEN